MVNKSKVIVALFILLILLGVYAPLSLASDNWAKTFGTTGDNEGKCVIQTSDGGFAIVGFTDSLGAGGYDIWVIKTDESGNSQWNKTFGTVDDEKGCGIVQIKNGFAILGKVISNSNPYCAWLIVTDESGNPLWNRTYIGSATALIKTADGGYAIAAGYRLIKTDANGEIMWTKEYSDIESVVQTKDGGYVLSGYYSTGSFLLKTDSKGDKQWNQTLELTDIGRANSLVQTDDGKYVVCGSIAGPRNSGGGFPTEFWLAKIDSSGDLQWSKKYPGPHNADEANGASAAYSVIQTRDGGFAIVGETNPHLIMVSQSFRANPIWLVKTDSSGGLEWGRTYTGEGSSNIAYSLIQTTDEGYLLTGITGKLYLDGAGISYTGNVLLLKTDETGAIADQAIQVSDSESANETFLSVNNLIILVMAVIIAVVVTSLICLKRIRR